jgi:hypothetical protein
MTVFGMSLTTARRPSRPPGWGIGVSWSARPSGDRRAHGPGWPAQLNRSRAWPPGAAGGDE